jgi:hypothetical protein
VARLSPDGDTSTVDRLLADRRAARRRELFYDHPSSPRSRTPPKTRIDKNSDARFLIAADEGVVVRTPNLDIAAAQSEGDCRMPKDAPATETPASPPLAGPVIGSEREFKFAVNAGDIFANEDGLFDEGKVKARFPLPPAMPAIPIPANPLQRDEAIEQRLDLGDRPPQNMRWGQFIQAILTICGVTSQTFGFSEKHIERITRKRLKTRS